jgi:hypothetical protein
VGRAPCSRGRAPCSRGSVIPGNFLKTYMQINAFGGILNVKIKKNALFYMKTVKKLASNNPKK